MWVISFQWFYKEVTKQAIFSELSYVKREVIWLIPNYGRATSPLRKCIPPNVLTVKPTCLTFFPYAFGPAMWVIGFWGKCFKSDRFHLIVRYWCSSQRCLVLLVGISQVLSSWPHGPSCDASGYLLSEDSLPGLIELIFLSCGTIAHTTFIIYH